MPLTPPAPPQSPSTAELVGEILNDAQELVGQQLELFKVEVQDDLRRSMRATVLLSAGLGFLLTSVVCLGLTLAWLLHDLGGLSMSASMGITFLVVAAVFEIFFAIVQRLTIPRGIRV